MVSSKSSSGVGSGMLILWWRRGAETRFGHGQTSRAVSLSKHARHRRPRRLAYQRTTPGLSIPVATPIAYQCAVAHPRSWGEPGRSPQNHNHSPASAWRPRTATATPAALTSPLPRFAPEARRTLHRATASRRADGACLPWADWTPLRTASHSGGASHRPELRPGIDASGWACAWPTQCARPLLVWANQWFAGQPEVRRGNQRFVRGSNRWF